MKKNNTNPRHPLIDPLALAAACIISLLFANATLHYLSTSKKNVSCSENQTVVCFQIQDDSFPEDRPDAWKTEKKLIPQKQHKNYTHLIVTFDLHRDYCVRLKGCNYGLTQPPTWLPSIPVAYRKLII